MSDQGHTIRVKAKSKDEPVTLQDLRDLVAVTQGMSEDTPIRAFTFPSFSFSVPGAPVKELIIHEEEPREPVTS